MPAPCEAPVTDPSGSRWRGLPFVTTARRVNGRDQLRLIPQLLRVAPSVVDNLPTERDDGFYE